MTANSQDAMVEAQASNRMAMPVYGVWIATIESLRARLLSEQAASKVAQQQAHSIAQKVLELQSRLDAEIEHRKKAKVAMAEVPTALKAKGTAMEGVMIDTYLSSESSVCGNNMPIGGSKGGESNHSSEEKGPRADAQDERHGSANSQGSADDPGLSKDSIFEQDIFSDKIQINLGDNSDYIEEKKEVVTKEEDESNGEQASEGHLNVCHIFPKGGKDSTKQLVDAQNDTIKCAKEEMNFQCREEEGAIEQSAKLRCNTVKYADGDVDIQRNCHAELKYVEGGVNTQSNGGEEGPSSAHNLHGPSVTDQVDAHEKEGRSGASTNGGQRVDDRTNVVPYLSNVRAAHNAPVPELETFRRPRPQDVHPCYANHGYAYGLPRTYAENLHSVASAEAPSLKGSLSFSNALAYHNQGLSTCKISEYDTFCLLVTPCLFVLELPWSTLAQMLLQCPTDPMQKLSPMAQIILGGWLEDGPMAELSWTSSMSHTFLDLACLSVWMDGTSGSLVAFVLGVPIAESGTNGLSY